MSRLDRVFLELFLDIFVLQIQRYGFAKVLEGVILCFALAGDAQFRALRYERDFTFRNDSGKHVLFGHPVHQQVLGIHHIKSPKQSAKTVHLRLRLIFVQPDLAFPPGSGTLGFMRTGTATKENKTA